MKKGFIYVIEVAIAGLLIALALSDFLATTAVRQHWERPDLIALGDSAFWAINASGRSPLVNSSIIGSVLPLNVRWALQVIGTPKPEINVGCVCDWPGYAWASSNIGSATLNGRQTVFKVSAIQPSDFPTAVLDGYDVLLFMDYTDFGGQKTKIQGFMDSGKGVVAINATRSNTDAAFNGLFGLAAGSGAATTINFTRYAPAENMVAKYFFGFGFDVNATGYVDGKRAGTWRIWEETRAVNITPALQVEVENKTTTEGRIIVSKGDRFGLRQPRTGATHYFAPKDVWPDKVVFQALDTGFVFNNFAEGEQPVVGANGKNVTGSGNMAATVANGTAIWMSDFPDSDEYVTLLKAAMSSLATNWWLEEPVSPKQPVTVNAFATPCCDAPETIEYVLWLWYAF